MLPALMEHSQLLVITNAQLALQHALNAVELRTLAANAPPLTICQYPHVILVVLLNIPLLNQPPHLHASIVRKPTVRLVLHLLSRRPVPPVMMDTISLEVPARLAQTPNVLLVALMEKLVKHALLVMLSLNLAPAQPAQIVDALLALLLEPQHAHLARWVIS